MTTTTKNSVVRSLNEDLGIFTFLTSHERKQVEAAVTDAEKMTSGEIKVLVVERSRLTFWYRLMLLWYLGRKAFHYLHMRHKTPRQRADLRALVEYFRLGVHNTKEATGVLVQICLNARWVTVVADKSINDKVLPDTWRVPCQTILDGIASGNRGEGICNAVAQIRGILAQHFPIQSGDVNEISNCVEFRR